MLLDLERGAHSIKCKNKVIEPFPQDERHKIDWDDDWIKDFSTSEVKHTILWLEVDCEHPWSRV